MNSRNAKSIAAARNLFAFLVAYSIAQASYAQTPASGDSEQEPSPSGILSGSAVDVAYGDNVSGAQITIVGTDISARTDMNGRFAISGLPEGSYTIIATASFYKPSRVEEVTIKAGEVTRIDVPLHEEADAPAELEQITVSAAVLENSEIGLLSKRQRAPVVSDAIGAESFGRLGLSDAADALLKVPGASIKDGKYLVMRGLSDRYNNTTLNGTTLPSADPNTKSVQLDQFPSGLLDAISTSKTFTPDMSGEFTGGSVNIETKSFPDRFFFNVSYGARFNGEVSDGDFLAYPGGDRDFLGEDDGARALPDIAKIPENLTSQVSLETRDEVINSFSPVMSPLLGDAPLGHRFSIAAGDSIDLFGNPLGYVASLTYRRDVDHVSDFRERRYDTFFSRSEDVWKIQNIQDMVGDRSTAQADVGAMLNLSYKLGDNHEVGLKNFYTQSGSDSAVFQEGPLIDSEDIFLRESRLHFIERTIRSNQIYGKHRFDSLGGATLEWDYADSRSTQDEPDFRIFFDRVRLRDYPDPEPSDFGFPVGLQNKRLFRELSEDGEEYGADLTVPLRVFGDRKGKVKAGFRKNESQRSFDELGLGFARDPRGGIVSFDGDRDNFLSEDNAGFDGDGVFRRAMIDATDFVPTYEGDREIDAFYLMADIPLLERLRLVAGGRYEDTFIRVESINRFGDPLANGTGLIEQGEFLPAANLVWSLTESQNLRFAASKTVARPNFRELSPVGRFTVVGNRRVIGNPDLEMTTIRNFDLRWELFGKGSDLLAVSLFFKDLDNPIEKSVNFVNQDTWTNVESGEVMGLELEARRQLGFLSSDAFALSVGGNFSYTDSEVDRSEEELARKRVFDPDTPDTRELQGQSDILVNLDATGELLRLGTTLTLSYNHTGERLEKVSIAQLPDIIEEPGDTLDFVVSQRLLESWKLKLDAGNLLNSEDRKFLTFFGEEKLYSSSRSGRTFTFSVSYDFN